MEDIKVSVLCTVYNHEKFIRKCLDGFVMQKTNFKYEVLVNDDCSNDNSRKIIEEFVTKYPEIIKPVYQKENQYSKGRSITIDILFPRSKGMYIAFCEGDDYWSDEKKLQRQFDFMEMHKECSMCTHNTIIHDLNNKEKDKYFNDKKKDGFLTDEEVFMEWLVHTSSYFVRREHFKIPTYLRGFWFGDYVRLTYSYTVGKIGYIAKTMSVYNNNNNNGITQKYMQTDVSKKIDMALKRAYYLKKLKRNCGDVSPFIDKRIRFIEYEGFMIEKGARIKAATSMNAAISYSREVIAHPCFKEYIQSMSSKGKLKILIKYKGYLLYPLWIRLWRNDRFS